MVWSYIARTHFLHPGKMDVRARAFDNHIQVLSPEVLYISPLFFLAGFLFPWTSRYVNHTLAMLSILCAEVLFYEITPPWIDAGVS